MWDKGRAVIQVQSPTDLTSELRVGGAAPTEPPVSSGDVLVWVPAVICLAMMLFFLLHGSGTSTGTGVASTGATCVTSRTGNMQC